MSLIFCNPFLVLIFRQGSDRDGSRPSTRAGVCLDYRQWLSRKCKVFGNRSKVAGWGEIRDLLALFSY
jgi:hypothetical protein